MREILLVEDNEIIVKGLKYLLEQEKFDIKIAKNIVISIILITILFNVIPPSISILASSKLYIIKKIIVFNKGGVIYFIFIILLSFATNSRYAILEPFGTFALLFLLSYIKHQSRLRQILNKKYICKKNNIKKESPLCSLFIVENFLCSLQNT